MRNPYLLFLLLVAAVSVTAQEKKVIDHTLYDSWKQLSSSKVSPNGEWISYEINPARGDGSLFLKRSDGQLVKKVDRGVKSSFSPDNQFFVFQIEPSFDTVRVKKLNKVKPKKMPKDSLGIYYLENDSMFLFPDMVSYKLPEKSGGWLAYMLEVSPVVELESDTLVADSLASTKSKKPEKSKKTLQLLNTRSGEIWKFEDVDTYAFSKNADLFVFNTAYGDSIDSTQVTVFDTKAEQFKTILEAPGNSQKITIDDAGYQLAFLFSSDTTEVKNQQLMYWNASNNRAFDQAIVAIDTTVAEMPEGWSVSENGTMNFSENGDYLYFGTAPIPLEKVEDSLLEKERAVVDIWSWTDDYLQPQQLKNLKKERKRTYLASWEIDKREMQQLASIDLASVGKMRVGDERFVIASDNRAYRQLQSWDGWYADYYLLDMVKQERKQIFEKFSGHPYLSPDGKYLAWYSPADSCWWGMSTSGDKRFNLTKDLKVNFYDEDHDTPSLPENYGFAGWTESGKFIVYDRYDLWQLDPRGDDAAEQISEGFGRVNEIRLRYAKVDRELHYIPCDTELYLSAFNRRTKESGYYSFTLKGKTFEPKELLMKPKQINGLRKAENADVFLFRCGDFQNYPELYISGKTLNNPTCLSETNPQQADYLWGSVSLMSWENFEGEQREGLLYKPENFDSSKSYPVLVYFYSRNSDNLHRYNSISPSRSVINVPYYLSNGYIVFVPNIRYRDGHPGKSAYSDIVSGAVAVGKNSWADASKMGIQGQSWGGYQVAYLVTQTDLFAAAEAGAPVSNMTSAYGGIRWASGMSRMFQYEHQQSRIGGTLWEKPMLYYENSPVFYADQVNTPLMIMHNDNDGAVPWYQGIEYFVALRRLGKPVWLLNYNGDSHNLEAESWGNRVDLSIRMAQFFDHYLKGDPAPKWMIEGIPAVNKGVDDGLELVK